MLFGDDGVEVEGELAGEAEACGLCCLQRGFHGAVAECLQVCRDVVRFKQGGKAAGEDAKEGDAEGVDVGGGGEGAVFQLLRAAIAEGQGVRACGGGAGLVKELLGAEIQQLGGALGGDEDVGGLDVAMEDEVAVDFCEGDAELFDDGEEGGGGGLRSVGEAVDALPGDVFHGDVGLAAGGRAGVEQAGDAGVGEAGEGVALVEELLRGEAASEGAVQELDGGPALRVVGCSVGAFCQVDDAGAAAADDAEKAVGAGRGGVRRSGATGGSCLRRGLLQGMVGCQEVCDLQRDGRAGFSLAVQQGGALRGWERKGLVEEELHLFEGALRRFCPSAGSGLGVAVADQCTRSCAAGCGVNSR